MVLFKYGTSPTLGYYLQTQLKQEQLKSQRMAHGGRMTNILLEPKIQTVPVTGVAKASNIYQAYCPLPLIT
jgi:hypothetical protein